jgi:hypothetical protein
MIRESERCHGVVLVRLVRGRDEPVLLEVHPELRQAVVVDDVAALYVKYSTNRLSPWSFVFSPKHHEELARLDQEFPATLVALACGGDGVVCLTLAECEHVLNDGAGLGEWMRVSRALRAKYAVTGSGGRPALRVGDNEFPVKVYDAIQAA